MTDPSKRKGDSFELEVQAWLRDHLGVPARRKLGAGRKDDTGDIEGVPLTVVSCANWPSKGFGAAAKVKPLEAETQRERAGEPFAATFIRLRGGDMRIVLTPDQYAALWREATA